MGRCALGLNTLSRKHHFTTGPSKISETSSQEQHAPRRALSGSDAHREALADVSQNWSQRVSHTQKVAIVHDFCFVTHTKVLKFEVRALVRVSRVVSVIASTYISCCPSRTAIMTWSSIPHRLFIAYTHGSQTLRLHHGA